MKKYLFILIFFFVALPVSAQLVPFVSKQLAPTPSNGNCLTTNGSINTWSSSCGSGGGGTFPFTSQSWGNSTSTTLGFLNGFLSTASSTIVGNATTTGGQYAGFLTIGTSTVLGAGTTFINGNTLSGGSATDNFLNITGTLPAVTSVEGRATNILITSAGSSAFTQRVMRMQLSAGYTGSATTNTLNIVNGAAGTGTSGWTLGVANYALIENANGVTTGHNVGSTNSALGSATLNLGMLNLANFATNAPALNIASAGMALNATTNVAGLFVLGNQVPTISTTSALIADNASSTTNAIFVAQSNGVIQDIIDGTGRFGIGTTSPGSLLSIGNTGGINFSPTSTSTFGSSANGINLINGCFAIGGVCIGSGSGTVTSVGISSGDSSISVGGTPVTTSGTLTTALNLGHTNTWTAIQNFFANASSTGFSANYASIGQSATTTITATGRIGVASTTPYAQVSINSTAGVDPLIIGSSTKSTFGVNQAGGITLSEALPATSTAITYDWNNTPTLTTYQMGTAAFTITVINATTSPNAGSRKMINVCNPTNTAGAISWKGVEWFGGTQPTQTTTGNACDLYSMFVTQATSTTAAFKVAGAMSANFQ